MSGHSPTLVNRLFVNRSRRVWDRTAFESMAALSDVPLHQHRSEDPALKDRTPLGNLVFQAIQSATPWRFENLPAALHALASPDLLAGPADQTELGTLMISCFADLVGGDKEREIMATWRRKVSQHLQHMGVDWEEAWRQASITFQTAQADRPTLYNGWRPSDALSRWHHTMKGVVQEAPHGLKDPSGPGCLRLMEEWWATATHWKSACPLCCRLRWGYWPIWTCPL